MMWQGNFVVVAFANVVDDILDVGGNGTPPIDAFIVGNDVEVVAIVDVVTLGVVVAVIAPSS
jgi:hypothetical protein